MAVEGSGHGGKRAGAGRKPASQLPKGCPPEIVEALKKAQTARALDVAARAITIAVAEGAIERSRADCLCDLLRERRALLKERRQERAVAQVRALEILTPGEEELLHAYRAHLAGPALRAGEAAPPPHGPDPDPSATAARAAEFKANLAATHAARPQPNKENA